MTDTSWDVRSPSGIVGISVRLEGGKLRYTVAHRDTEVVGKSRLGVVRSDTGLDSDLHVHKVAPAIDIDEAYTLLHGKALRLRDRATEQTITFANSLGDMIALVVRAYDDGVAFRYVLVGSTLESATITSEETSFALADPGAAWIQPTQHPTMHAPAYEDLHSKGIPIGATAPGPAWNLPALFMSGEHWVLITESDTDGSYFGAHLGAEPAGREYEIVLPQGSEGNGIGDVEPSSHLPWRLPWRVIVVAPDLGSIVESSLVSHLSRAAEVADTAWIRPGRVAWSWWSDVASPQNLDSLRAYVDFAAEMGWEHTLVDANWTVHTQGDMQDLVAYAAERGVGVFLWYNSGGPHNVVTEQPRDLMADAKTRRAEMQRIASWGVAGMKVDFFQSDKQVGIQLIEGILADAADYHLMVNLHGCTIPRGWTRRWPHLMTLEAVPGAEQYIFAPTFPQAAPSNNTILPFTRNVIGPMDYTPVTFSDQQFPHLTTAAHELALAVIFESSLQHFADAADSYREQLPEVQSILRSVPTIWDETRFVAGWPGEYVVLARRYGTDWYVAGINGQETSHTLELALDFIPASTQFLVITDGSSRDDVTTANSETFGTVPAHLTMAPYGGFLVRGAAI